MAIEYRYCVICGVGMGYCTSRKQTCSDKCRKEKSRKGKKSTK